MLCLANTSCWRRSTPDSWGQTCPWHLTPTQAMAYLMSLSWLKTSATSWRDTSQATVRVRYIYLISQCDKDDIWRSTGRDSTSISMTKRGREPHRHSRSSKEPLTSELTQKTG